MVRVTEMGPQLDSERATAPCVSCGGSKSSSFQNYSCITDALLNIESIYVLDRNMVSKYGTPPLAILCNFYFIAEITFVFLTYKTLNIGQMSPKLRKLQRRLLLQLTVQAFLPFLLICIPGSFIIAIIAFEIFGYFCKFWF